MRTFPVLLILCYMGISVPCLGITQTPMAGWYIGSIFIVKGEAEKLSFYLNSPEGKRKRYKHTHTRNFHYILFYLETERP